jgi:uncharacterized protein (DUF2267 family)
MRVTKLLVRTTEVAAATVGVIAVAAPESPPGRAVRRVGARVTRDVRYFAASAPGIGYRLAGRSPDPNVSDDILADRVRSTIGPLEKRLDIPRVHVMVEDHVALLHGDVPNAGDAGRVEDAVLHVSGIDGVESHLHVGLIDGDTRPSEGTVTMPSDAYENLVDAARGAGASHPVAAVHAVLCGFADRVPEHERAQLLGQLPSDVRALTGPPRRHGTRTPRMKTIPQLVAAVTAEGGIEPDRAETITRAVLGALHGLVPYEARDVAATLPSELRTLWEESRTGGA